MQGEQPLADNPSGPRTQPARNLTSDPERRPSFVVGIGASAGGLEALERFFEKVPPQTGLAFVVVQHLSPDFKSLTDELLARRTPIPIHRVTDGMEVHSDAIYLIPPRKDMIVANGRLLLTDKDPSQVVALPIDHFFRSLAQDAGERAVAVILSGTGSDGSRGIRDVHEAGGLVVVQLAETAKFDGMPNSALKTGTADLVLPPEEMPAALLKYIKHPLYQDPARLPGAAPPAPASRGSS
jgi:two-component system CheB/CheR fusion protein